MLREIFGKKIGMTQVFDAAEDMVPITLIEINPVYILEKASSGPKQKVRIGCFPLAQGRTRLIKKPQLGYFEKLKITPYRLIREVETEHNTDLSFLDGNVKEKAVAASPQGEKTENAPAATEQAPDKKKNPTQEASPQTQEDKLSDPREVGVEIFKEGELVDVRAKTKGRGFAGGMKRWNWHGQPQTHGSMTHRRIGSAGASAYPSRIVKGHHMPGHYGNAYQTMKNLKVVKIDKEKNLLFVHGSIPGHRGTIVKITRI
jgi:large subunit ribosomal protein L3